MTGARLSASLYTFSYLILKLVVTLFVIYIDVVDTFFYSCFRKKKIKELRLKSI